MPEEACAAVCAMLCAVCAVLSWSVMLDGNWKCMILVAFYGSAAVLIAGYVLVYKYLL